MVLNYLYIKNNMSCCGRKFIITEEEKLDIMKLYGLLLEGETTEGGYEIDFSNTFESGKHSTQYINKQLLTTELNNAKTWLLNKLKEPGNKGKLVYVEIDASESKVPNADAENGGIVLPPYQLSNKRAVSINNYLSGIFDGWVKENLVPEKPIFSFPPPKIGGPNWCPNYSKDPECEGTEKNDKKTDQKFTEHQYVRVKFLLDDGTISAKCLEGLSITVAYNQTASAAFPCRGGHKCDEADFNVLLNRVSVGSVSLNNANDGGSRTGTVTVTPQQATAIAKASTDKKKIDIYLKCKFAKCHSSTPEITISKGGFTFPNFPRCVPSITDRDDYTLKHILSIDVCGNVTQQNNDQKSVLPDEQFIKKPTDLVEGYLYYNEDTKQFEFSNEWNGDYTEHDDTVSTYTVRHPLYGIGPYDVSGADLGKHEPAQIYKQGCTATDKANYGNYCIWGGPKLVYSKVNRSTYPPYGAILKIEKWKFGKNTGNVMEAGLEAHGPEGWRLEYSGLGKSSKYYNEDGTEKPQPD
jgi:hypothetical protein